jgi:hypothetical protein
MLCCLGKTNMTSALTISGKVIGKTQPLFTHWELLLPERTEQTPLTLRDLLTQIVLAEIAGFTERQTQRRLMQILTPAQIRLGVEQGKVESGGSDLEQEIDPEGAIATALQSFTDGLYFVFLDEQQQENLDDIVTLQPNSELLFLRLVPLVGG